MVDFIITGHGGFSAGMLSALEMIAGPQEGVTAIAFHESEAAAFPEKIRSAIARAAQEADGVVVFCDLVGGTPFNQTMIAAQSVPGTEVMAGTNLPMLLECIMVRDGAVREVVDTAVESGQTGVAHMTLPDNDAAAETWDDGEEGGI